MLVIAIIIIAMSEAGKPARPALSTLALQAWVSPAYPVGGYAYSHALETAIDKNNVHDADTLAGWVSDNLQYGSGWNDAVLFVETMRRFQDPVDHTRRQALYDIAELASAMCLTSELQQECLQQGAAFLGVTCAAWPHGELDSFRAEIENKTAYPVCFAVAAAAHQIDRQDALQAYLLTMTSNWISAAVRLNVVGQTMGQRLAAASALTIQDIAEKALPSSLDDLGGSIFLNEIASFQHETQNARLFRS